MRIGNRNRVIFMGTPEFAVKSFSALIEADFNVVAAYTREPSRRGRGKTLQQTPVHALADANGIPVHTPKTLKTPKALETLQAYNADIIIVVAYGKILPRQVLMACPFGCINVHGSLLPRWRGAAPINRAIMARDKETGVDIMLMDEGLDTGDVLISRRLPITPTMTAGFLHDSLSKLGAEALPLAVRGWIDGTLSATPQAGYGETYARKLKGEDRKIDWSNPAHVIHGQIMGLSPRPGAWFMFRTDSDAEPIRVQISQSRIIDNTTNARNTQKLVISNSNEILVRCSDGNALSLLRLKPAGKQEMSANSFIAGYLSDLQNSPVELL